MGHSESELISHNSKDEIKLRIFWWVKVWSLDERTAVQPEARIRAQAFCDFLKS
jgi:hypothetical protein